MSPNTIEVTYGNARSGKHYTLKMHQDILIDDVGIGKVYGPLSAETGHLPVMVSGAGGDGRLMMVSPFTVQPLEIYKDE
eukprot:3335135-Prymnesium_polylepis.1